MRYRGFEDAAGWLQWEGGVYALADPRCGRIRYIGRAGKFYGRYQTHIGGCKGEASRTGPWIRDVLASGSKPLMVALDDEKRREYAWLAAMADNGCDLLNSRHELGFASRAQRKVSRATWVAIARTTEDHVDSIHVVTAGDLRESWMLFPLEWASRLQEKEEARLAEYAARWDREEKFHELARAEARSRILSDELVNQIRGGSR